MTGYEKCEKLKKLRKVIADVNDIEYEIVPCPHTEDCIGTCPRCDAELKYLTDKLAEKVAAGEEVLLEGIAPAEILSTVVSMDKVSYESRNRFNINVIPVENEISPDSVDGGYTSLCDFVDDEQVNREDNIFASKSMSMGGCEPENTVDTEEEPWNDSEIFSGSVELEETVDKEEKSQKSKSRKRPDDQMIMGVPAFHRDEVDIDSKTISKSEA